MGLSSDQVDYIAKGLDGLLLDDDDRIRLFPADDYHAIPHQYLRVWCNQRARFTVPTIELIQWLKDRIGDRKAIEIGSGNGDLGYHLGITQTDNFNHTCNPNSALYFAIGQQVPTRPKSDVICIEAEQAVQKYRPDVVIGSWITRRFVRGVDVEGEAQANFQGPVEEKVLRGCAEYIHIGNLSVHDQKTLLSLPHEVYDFPWLVSRALDQSLNRIWVWKNPYYPEGRRK